MDQTHQVAVVVTTSHRGVFFGYVPVPVTGATDTITLTQARMCLRWSSPVHGVLGLAVTGPLLECRVGPAVPTLHLTSVTSIMEATPAAVAAWEAEPWSR